MVAVERRRKSQNQIEKDAKTRKQILKAAAVVVGKLGYQRASIAKITDRAKVAMGTFYLHFQSKEDIYNELLPWCGEDLIEYTDDKVQGTSCYMEFEERNMRAFFGYGASHPYFFRILNEAETVAPQAYQTYLNQRAAGYIQVLNDAWDRGEFPTYDRSEMESICHFLIGVRKSVYSNLMSSKKKPEPLSEDVLQTYLAFVFGALHPNNREQIRKLWPKGIDKIMPSKSMKSS